MSDVPPASGGPPYPAPPGAPEPLPWEAPDVGLGALLPTVGRFITRPIDSFERMSLTVDLVRPLAYYVALVLFSAVMSQIWNAIFRAQIVGFLHRMLESSGQGALWQQLEPGLAHTGGLQVVLALILTPLVYLVILFVWAAMSHGTLLLVGGAPKGFAATLRALSYAATALVAGAVPVFGGLIGFFWYLVLGMIGLSAAHRTEGWKAALAILLPLALCCLCCIGASVMFGAAIGQAIRHATP
jgi:hypothetical protein